MKKFTIFLIILTGITVLSAAQTGNDFRQEGIASWYGNEFDGRPTASGEIFNSTLLTAAHPTLPFGTILTVTNKQNNRQVTVRVNDRGPFVSARIVDLSKAAAEVLDMLSTGTAPVLLERSSSQSVAVSETNNQPQPYSEPAREAVAEVTPAAVYSPSHSGSPAVLIGSVPQAGSSKLYRVQVGSYRIARNATDAFEKLRKAGLNPAYEQNGEFYRVVLARLGANEIQSIAQTLGNAGFREALIREEKGL